LLEQTLRDAYRAGVVLVAASGNDALPNVGLPAADNHVIAVGASTLDGGLASYSNHGAALDLLAPGGDYEDRDEDGYPEAILQVSFAPGAPADFHHYFGAGTSQAAAHVSAAAAILLRRVWTEPRRRPLRVRNLLQQYASNEGVWSEQAGYGMVRLAESWAGAEPDRDLEDWQGYVAQPHSAYPEGVFGVLHDEPEAGPVLFLETPSEGVYGFADDPDGDGYAGGSGPAGPVLAFAVPGAELRDVYRHGVRSFLQSRGGLHGLVDALGAGKGLVQVPGGLMGLVDTTGRMAQVLEELSGSGRADTLLYADPSGTVVQRIEESGGFAGMMNGSGGFVGMMNGSGGFVGMMNGSGEPLGLVAGSEWETGTLLGSGLLDPPLGR
jgi:hypothetical protein